MTFYCRFSLTLEVKKSRQKFDKALLGEAYFQVKLRFEAHHLDLNLFQKKLCRKSCFEIATNCSSGVLAHIFF